jgi:SAM-dependent methyltransferase
MREDIIRAQQDNSLTKNYNKWIFDNISPFVGDRVMDVGAGLGNFIPFLSTRDLVLAIDTLDIFLNNLNKEYSSYANILIRKCDVQEDAVVSLGRECAIDTVICNNVLEHVENDLKALNNIRKILDSNGKLIIIVPAFKFLYSNWDRSVGHFRRYTHSEIKDKLRKADFTVLSNSYMNMFGVLGWFLNGRIIKNTPNKNFFVRRQAIFFDRYMVRLLRCIEAKMHPPFGLSLIVIARPT